MKPRFMLLQKSAPVESSDGTLTPSGLSVAYQYAKHWVADGVRDLEAEKKYPSLTGLFYDLRSDPNLAREYSSEEPVKKSLEEQVVMVRSEIQTLPLGKLLKAGTYYEGPRGGKWADPDHTIPWDPDQGQGRKHGAPEEESGRKPAGAQQPTGKEHGKQLTMEWDKDKAGEKPTAPTPAGAEGEQAKPPVEPIKIQHKHIPLGSKKKSKEYVRKEEDWVSHYPGLPASTDDAYRTPDGDYIPERRRMHDEIIADAIKNKVPVPPNQKPVAIVMMGGAASGKTTLVGTQFGDKGLLGNFVVVNADDVKEQLPEYDMAVSDVHHTAKDAAAMVHEESSTVAKRLLATVSKTPGQQYNLVFDGTGANPEGYGRMMADLKAKGYHVNLIYADVANPDEAIGRAKDRASTTGRHVPEEHARYAHASIPQNYEKLAAQADSHTMFATEHNKPHRPIMSGGAGKTQIHDTSYLSSFRERARKLEAEHPNLPKPWEKHAATPAPTQAQAPAAAVPEKPVAKSLESGHTKGGLRKAMPQPERFVMRQPNAPAPQPQGSVAPGTQPPAQPQPAVDNRPPAIDIDALREALSNTKPDPEWSKTPAKSGKDKKGAQGPVDDEASLRFPVDDLSWAIEALDPDYDPNAPGAAAYGKPKAATPQPGQPTAQPPQATPQARPPQQAMPPQPGQQPGQPMAPKPAPVPGQAPSGTPPAAPPAPQARPPQAPAPGVPPQRPPQAPGHPAQPTPPAQAAHPAQPPQAAPPQQPAKPAQPPKPPQS